MSKAHVFTDGEILSLHRKAAGGTAKFRALTTRERRKALNAAIKFHDELHGIERTEANTERAHKLSEQIVADAEGTTVSLSQKVKTVAKKVVAAVVAKAAGTFTEISRVNGLQSHGSYLVVARNKKSGAKLAVRNVGGELRYHGFPNFAAVGLNGSFEHGTQRGQWQTRWDSASGFPGIYDNLKTNGELELLPLRIIKSELNITQ